MPWWGIPAIIGGALGGWFIAVLAGSRLGVSKAKPLQQKGGGPKWRTDESGDLSRFGRDNALKLNPFPLIVVLGLATTIAGLAIGLSLS